MRQFSVLMTALALSLAPTVTPAQAATEDGAWQVTGDTATVGEAGITIPMTMGALSLVKTGEISDAGAGIDNQAQYMSADGAIQASAYVYLPSFADASIAAYMTDQAITSRFGAQTRRTAYASVAAGGVPGTAIRAVYDDAADGQLTTAAAFVHAGRWMVKLRVTGPAERRAEVLAGIDGMLAGLRFADAAKPAAAQPLRLAQCPAAASATAQRIAIAASPSDLAAREPGAPRDGRDALCVRGHVQTADARFDMLQAPAEGQSGASGSILIPVDDSGTLVAFDPIADGKGYRLSIHSVGQTQVFDAYDRLPSDTQIAAIIDGKDPVVAQARATTAYAANGEETVSLHR